MIGAIIKSILDTLKFIFNMFMNFVQFIIALISILALLAITILIPALIIGVLLYIVQCILF